MSVYVDGEAMDYVNPNDPRKRNMKMCHMVADTEEELIEMARKLNLKQEWHQYKGTPKSHFDICKSKRALAVKLGAIPIDRHELVTIIRRKREKSVVTPAIEW